jgi:hypothetical protein
VSFGADWNSATPSAAEAVVAVEKRQATEAAIATTALRVRITGT